MSREYAHEYVVQREPGDDWEFLDQLMEAVEQVLPRCLQGCGVGNGNTGRVGYLFMANQTAARRYRDRLNLRLGVDGTVSRYDHA